MSSPEPTRRPGSMRVRFLRREAEADGLIPASPQQLWDVITDPTRIQQWWPRALGGMIIDGDGDGREQVVRLDWGRSEGRIRQRVTVWNPPSRYEWRVVSEAAGDRLLPPLADTRVTVTIAREQHGSRVHIFAHYEPAGPRGAMALRQIVKLARKSYRKAIKNLERLFQAPAG